MDFIGKDTRFLCILSDFIKIYISLDLRDFSHIYFIFHYINIVSLHFEFSNENIPIFLYFLRIFGDFLDFVLVFKKSVDFKKLF